MAVHIVKTWREMFAHVWDGKKPFEVRKNDRDYRVGDLLIQREYDKDGRTFTGRYVRAIISYKLDGGQFGVEPGYCVLALVSRNNFFDDMHPLDEDLAAKG